MRGILLGLESHDLDLDASGRFSGVAGDPATRQEIKTRVLFQQGESFTDQREGTPFFQEILIKGYDIARVKAILRRAIASVPAVVDVPILEVAVDPETRRAGVNFEARTIDGGVIRSADFGTLIV